MFLLPLLLAVINGCTHLSNSQKSSVLQKHNVMRNAVKWPSIQWSQELENLACQNIVHNLAGGCNIQHSPPPDTGENLQSCWGPPGTNCLDDFPLADGWVKELKYFTSSFTSYNTNDFEQNGHLTQMTDPQSTHVGCALLDCQTGDWAGKVMTCLYQPPGNYMDQQSISKRWPNAQQIEQMKQALIRELHYQRSDLYQ